MDENSQNTNKITIDRVTEIGKKGISMETLLALINFARILWYIRGLKSITQTNFDDYFRFLRKKFNYFFKLLSICSLRFFIPTARERMNDENVNLYLHLYTVRTGRFFIREMSKYFENWSFIDYTHNKSY